MARWVIILVALFCAAAGEAQAFALLGLELGAAQLAARSVPVREYTKKDGTHVKPHYRSAPNGSARDNWSTKGNENPHTGKEGTKNPEATPSRPRSSRPYAPAGRAGASGAVDSTPAEVVQERNTPSTVAAENDHAAPDAQAKTALGPEPDGMLRELYASVYPDDKEHPVYVDLLGYKHKGVTHIFCCKWMARNSASHALEQAALHAAQVEPRFSEVTNYHGTAKTRPNAQDRGEAGQNEPARPKFATAGRLPGGKRFLVSPILGYVAASVSSAPTPRPAP